MGVMQIPGHTRQKPREVTLDEIRAVLGDCRLCSCAKQGPRSSLARAILMHA